VVTEEWNVKKNKRNVQRDKGEECEHEVRKNDREVLYPKSAVTPYILTFFEVSFSTSRQMTG
jgi:hypothetical protein